MNTRFLIKLLLLSVFLLPQGQLLAREKTQYKLPDDPTKAWVEVGKVYQALSRPAEWRTKEPGPDEVAQFQKQVRQTAMSFAEKAREFMGRFPTHEKVGDARINLIYALNNAVAAGDSDAEKELAAFVSTVLADNSIQEDDRVVVLVYAGNVVFMKAVGMRLFTEGMSKLSDEFEAATIENLRVALKQFPNSSMLYTMLVSFAQRAKGEQRRELATEIINGSGAPAGAKTLAKHILKGTKPYRIGKPLDIQFTALDGREVDMAKMKGKVVLVQFWSTTCGPCIAEMPTVKAVYEKFHGLGFEVIAISLDDSEAALRRFIKEKKLPWPQHFDGKGWENKFGVQYGIFNIPTMWLVDNRGNLSDTDAGHNLEERVTSLIGKRTP
mgnify:CR=1 FL=1